MAEEAEKLAAQVAARVKVVGAALVKQSGGFDEVPSLQPNAAIKFTLNSRGAPKI